MAQITSYADPSLCFFGFTVAAGVKLLEKNPEPTETADHSPDVDGDSEAFPSAEPTNSGSSTSLEGVDKSKDAGSDILPGASASTAAIPVILAAVVAMFSACQHVNGNIGNHNQKLPNSRAVFEYSKLQTGPLHITLH